MKLENTPIPIVIMSTPKEPVHEGTLLRKALGAVTAKAFAAACGVSAPRVTVFFKTARFSDKAWNQISAALTKLHIDRDFIRPNSGPFHLPGTTINPMEILEAFAKITGTSGQGLTDGQLEWLDELLAYDYTNLNILRMCIQTLRKYRPSDK